ncbi:putative alpha-L-fucosidase 1 [Platanthera guangdongensis]|uniref:alpha-L-fucosidase n=1 Tax=Platanthera guangdongensis TaxID=2320717 RepID=A0ABR2M178_9ASPA
MARSSISTLFFLLSLSSSTAELTKPSSQNTPWIPPPLPLPPLPSASQLKWQQGEMAMFLHFGPNTFTDSEWGSGQAEPSIFFPTNLDPRQWAAVASAAGFSRLVLTAKHHDGFCLWPSTYTNYSVRSSPWRSGDGDVVAILAAAAREFSLGLGLYLSPWDRHEPCYGKTLEYNEYFLGQMTELLTCYGDIQEVWLDGAKGKDEKDMVYLFDSWFELIHQLQPGAIIFSDAGPDSRWIGDEDAVAGTTCWSLFNKSSTAIGDTKSDRTQGLPSFTRGEGQNHTTTEPVSRRRRVAGVASESEAAGVTSGKENHVVGLANRSRTARIGNSGDQNCLGQFSSVLFFGSTVEPNLISPYPPRIRYSLKGDPHGHDWVAPECDVSIRRGWFWHSSEHPKSPLALLEIYYTSVGRNCLLILNVPPNSLGLISDEDIQVLQNFTAMRRTIFSHNFAEDAIVSAGSTRGGLYDPRFIPSNVIQEGIRSYWAPEECQTNWTLILDLRKSVSFNVLLAQEPIQMGQRVMEFHADVFKEGEWRMIANGTTIGYKRLLLFPVEKAQLLRFVIDKSRADPLISYLGLYFDPFSTTQNLLNASRRPSFNDTGGIGLRLRTTSSNRSLVFRSL